MKNRQSQHLVNQRSISREAEVAGRAEVFGAHVDGSGWLVGEQIPNMNNSCRTLQLKETRNRR
ncbi:hypothetical protein J6590_027117 [Homalodisca vitripennis]|nr:hypothetical protein J6590_027117 [Homalodisca vitripennis]